MNVAVVPYIAHMAQAGRFYIYFLKSCIECFYKLYGVIIRHIGSAEARHCDAYNVFIGKRQHLHSLNGYKKCQRRIKSAGNTDDCALAMGMRQTFFQSHSLDI